MRLRDYLPMPHDAALPEVLSPRFLSQAVVTTTIRLQFDCNSTALRPFDDLRYDP